MPRKAKQSTTQVFISHSHADREVATNLQAILEKCGADTYMDQDRILTGDVLPKRIAEGIGWCDTFLLIWSSSAATSKWVTREWNMAHARRKEIVPYVVDGTPLPPGLSNLVYIDIKDRELSDTRLLTAVLGPDFQPDPTTLFPGRWRAVVDTFGMAIGTYDLVLRPNGQMEVEGAIGPQGPAYQMAGSQGMAEPAATHWQVQGSWSYDRGTQMLTLNMTASAFGQTNREVITIRTTGRESQAQTGQDLCGRTWTAQRMALNSLTRSSASGTSRESARQEREVAAAAGAARSRPTDDVYFAVTSPAEVAPKADFLVNVWAHLDAQREAMLKRAHQAEPKTELQAPGRGPFAIAQDTELDVLLSIEDCSVEPEQETIRWTGAIANAGFSVRVNDDASEGNKRSHASVRHGGLEIARVRFLLKVTSAPSATAVTDTTSKPHRSAFASYARDDSHDVLTCIQGMEKALPGISVFIDVLKFRSGEYWDTMLQQEILASDVFYLFWSKAAADSEWVEREWRFGFQKKGLDFIDPVPLVSPRLAPPPSELSSKHFDDWELAFKSYQEGVKRRVSTATGGSQP